MTIDWEFELQVAQGKTSAKAVTDVVELAEGKKLDRFSYENAKGHQMVFKVPDELYTNGFANMIVDGLPLELTVLPGNRVEIIWVVGLHDHAK